MKGINELENTNILKRQYGLFVATCIVVGFIVGTGIFWRPGRVLYESGGSLFMGILAWVIGGLVISTCVYMFSIMATQYEKIHGMVDYAEAVVGKKYGYLAGWFFCIMYQTAGYAIIAWISASFTATLAGGRTDANFILVIAVFYMVGMFIMNYFAPKLPMRLNSITTIARLIPLILMGFIGVAISLVTPDTSTSVMETSIITNLGEGIATPSFMGAIFATVFAYNGWQAAVAFNSEVKDSKRNFPIALICGFFVVMIIYVLYFIGVVTAGDSYELMRHNQLGTRNAFANVFGDVASDIILVFVIISGLGILNMCCMGMSRSLYSLARRGVGPMPNKMIQLNPKTGIPQNSMIVCVCVSFLWMVVQYGNQNLWFGMVNERPFRFELPDFYNLIFFILLIPIFIGFLISNHKNQQIHWFNRLIAPAIATIGAGFMVYASVISSPIHAVVYMSAFVVLTLIGIVFWVFKT